MNHIFRENLSYVKIDDLFYMFVSVLKDCSAANLGPNIHWTSNYGTGIVFIGNMLSWLSFHKLV